MNGANTIDESRMTREEIDRFNEALRFVDRIELVYRGDRGELRRRVDGRLEFIPEWDK